MLVSISAIALVSPEELGEGETPLLKVVQAGAPGFPLGVFGIITMFAVANSALINMLMASRLIYGMSREHVLPAVLGKVHATRRTPYIAIGFTTLLAFALIAFVGEVPALGGTTALLLLCVFTVVNVAVLVLRKDTVDAQALPRADLRAGARRAVLRLSRRPVDRPRSAAIRHRRHAHRHRHRAVVRDHGGEQAPGSEAGRAAGRRPLRARPEELGGEVPERHAPLRNGAHQQPWFRMQRR